MKEIIKSILITCAIIGTIAILSLIAHYISFKFPETFTTVITYGALIGTFSLFVYLALAAMTDNAEGNYGEYWVCIRDNTWFTKDDLYKSIGVYHDKSPMFYDNEGAKNGAVSNHLFKYFRKATKEEIITKFGENNENTNNLTKDSKMTKKEDLRELLQSGRIIEFRDGDIGIIIQTHLGLLVQYEDTWNNFNGYEKDLTHNEYPRYDIVKIREIRAGYQISRRNFLDAQTIWERKGVKEYTLDEVFKMAGLDKAEVKIVG